MGRHRGALISTSSRAVGAALWVFPASFLLVFFIYPLSALVAAYGDVSVFGRVLTDGDTWRILWFTTWQAAVSTVISLILGLFHAFVNTRWRFRGQRILDGLLLAAFVLPSVVVAAAFAALLGEHGPLGRLSLVPSTAAIVMAHVFFNLAVVSRMVGARWSVVDAAQEDAARVLGASSWHVWRHVLLPQLRPAISAATSIVFLFCFTSFGIVLLLGDRNQVTLDVEIYRTTFEYLDLRTAMSLLLIQALVVAAFLLWRFRGADLPPISQARANGRRRPARLPEHLCVTAHVAIVSALIGMPLATMVYKSVNSASHLTLGAYRRLLVDTQSSLIGRPIDALAASLRFAALAALMATAVGVFAALAINRGRRGAAALEAMIFVPLGISSVALGLGFLLSLDQRPIDLRQSGLLVPLAQALVALPFVVGAALPLLRTISPLHRDAARTLGANERQVWQAIDFPVIRQSLSVGVLFAFIVSLGEFGATIFISRDESVTIPVLISRLLSRPGSGNFQQAMALSVVLMALTLMAMGLLSTLRRDEPAAAEC